MHELVIQSDGRRIALPDALGSALEATPRDRFRRRSRLYVPLVREEFLEKAGAAGADGLIFDLEDSVPFDQKARARSNVTRIPQAAPGIERILRINGLAEGLLEEDLPCLDVYPFDSVMIPKVESPDAIELVRSSAAARGRNVIALIETIDGLWNVRDIAAALQPGDAMGCGAGDLSMAFGIPREPMHRSPVLQHAFLQVLMAARARGLDVFEPPFRDFRDLATLREEAEHGRRCGAIGKQAIHPSQIQTIHSVYTPAPDELERFVADLLAFAGQRDRMAVHVNGSYLGKPSRRFAESRLIDALRRGHASIERVPNLQPSFPVGS